MKTQKRSLFSSQALAAGGGGDDNLVGTSGDDELRGWGGNDTLSGLGGNDLLDGGAGNDALYGGTGDDIYYIDSAGDRAIEVAYEGFDILYTSVSFAADPDGEIEAFIALDPAATTALDISADRSDNLIQGNEGANRLTAGLGDDILYGFGGNDILSAGDGVDTLYGGAGDDRLIGGEGFDVMYGGAGNDIFDAVSTRQYGDKNRMYGDVGNDTYYVDRSGDLVFETPGQGFDTVHTIFSYRLQYGNEVEAVYGTGPEVLELVGNDLSNRLYGPDSGALLRGLEHDDLLTGGAGNDTFDGGDGSDTASYASATAAVSVSLAVTTAQNTKGAGSDTLTSIENLLGSAFADVLTGDGAANLLSGGPGADLMNGGDGSDVYVADNAGDRAVESSASGGIDTVRSMVSFTLGANVENLALVGAGAINGTGNALANTITGNAAGNLLRGGGGRDSLKGGAGADSFQFDTAPAAANLDHILDFTRGADRILLDNAVFTGLADGPLAPGAFALGGTATNPGQRILYDAATSTLSFDRDGSGAAAAVAFAVLDNHPSSLAASDFVVI